MCELKFRGKANMYYVTCNMGTQEQQRNTHYMLTKYVNRVYHYWVLLKGPFTD